MTIITAITGTLTLLVYQHCVEYFITDYHISSSWSHYGLVLRLYLHCINKKKTMGGSINCLNLLLLSGSN